jgi:chromosome segregation ATPase
VRLKEKAEGVRKWYNEQFHNLKRQEEKLASAKEKATALDGKLAEREARLNAREKDLAKREEALAAKLHGKDEEIEKLLVQRTHELEKNHKETIDTQARKSAAKLKEATNKAATAASAKVELESQVSKLQETLAGNSKEIEGLKDAAQKAAHTLGELQT